MAEAGSRSRIEPLSRVTLPAQMLKLTPPPAKALVTTKDELATWSAPRIRTSSVELETSRVLFTPRSLKRRVFVKFGAAQMLRLLMERLPDGVSASMVTVLLPAFVT